MMSRTSCMAGLAFSMVLHAAIFLPWLPGSSPQDHQAQQPEDTQPRTVEVRAAAEPPPPEAQAVSSPPEPSDTNSPLPEMAEVVDAGSRATDGQAGDLAREETDEGLPPLEIVWDGPERARQIAGHLGLRILAVSADEKLLGEVSPRGELRLMPFEGELSAYSNRMRTLPANFWPELGTRGGTPITHFWVLVPRALDERFVELQRDALRRSGVEPADARAVVARFVDDGRGGFELRIVRVEA